MRSDTIVALIAFAGSLAGVAYAARTLRNARRVLDEALAELEDARIEADAAAEAWARLHRNTRQVRLICGTTRDANAAAWWLNGHLVAQATGNPLFLARVSQLLERDGLADKETT